MVPLCQYYTARTHSTLSLRICTKYPFYKIESNFLRILSSGLELWSLFSSKGSTPFSVAHSFGHKDKQKILRFCPMNPDVSFVKSF